ncbi:MAG TPA: adenosylmethionine decarboxylase [bacterium]|nr:adenosylmethionine decarboxylase [bacterium]
MSGGAEMVSGRHVMVELYGCSYKTLSDLELIKQVLIDIATRLGSRILSEHFVKLDPGISGVLMIGESHISIHTWPEKSYASIDIYTCNKNSDLDQALLFVKKRFNPIQQCALLVERGLPEGFRVTEMKLVESHIEKSEMAQHVRE